MGSRIHPQPRTTPKIGREIKDSGVSDRQAAKVFGMTRATAKNWLKRDDVQDRCHRAHTLHTTLNATQGVWADLIGQCFNKTVDRLGLGRLERRFDRLDTSQFRRPLVVAAAAGAGAGAGRRTGAAQLDLF